MCTKCTCTAFISDWQDWKDLTNEKRDLRYLDNLSNDDESRELLEMFDLLLYHQEDLHHKQTEQFIRIIKQALQNHVPNARNMVDVESLKKD